MQQIHRVRSALYVLTVAAAGTLAIALAFSSPARAASLDQEIDQFFNTFSENGRKVRRRDRKKRRNGIVLQKLKDRRGRNTGVISIGGNADQQDPSRRNEYRSKYYSGGREPGYEPGIIKFRIRF